MTDAALTVEAVRAKGWECVRLGPRRKKPIDRHWTFTTNPSEVAAWFAAGFNVGLMCHERTGVAVLDPDKLLLWADMFDALGQPSLPWVITGSGKLHYYIQWVPDLPAKLTWGEETIGEIQRGPGQQQVVLPPSIHPDTGAPYRWITEAVPWLVEPIHPVVDPLPRLPEAWREHLQAKPHAHRR
jgi:Bifunctional DNA primase/polymerase, N-terminal